MLNSKVRELIDQDASRKNFWQEMLEAVMHWLDCMSHGCRMGPKEKPGVWWADWCTLLHTAWLGCFSGRGAWDPLTMTGFVETRCMESGLFFLVQHGVFQALINSFEHVQRQLLKFCPSIRSVKIFFYSHTFKILVVHQKCSSNLVIVKHRYNLKMLKVFVLEYF